MEPRDPKDFHDDDLQPVADWLRAQRPEVSALDLDRIKRRARAQAMRGEPTRGAFRGRRTVATVLSALVLTASVGGAFAIAGQNPPSPNSGGANNSASTKQYQPGKGCGDQNHTHQPPPPPQPNPCP